MNEPAKKDGALSPDYFRIRDFEYVQPLYDLAFLLEVDALATGAEVPKYRTFSLWRAGYSLDGYGTTIDRWLDGGLKDEDLDYLPSSRIREYLKSVRKIGTTTELKSFRSEQYSRCLRLRSVRGLGPSQIALTVAKRDLSDEWFDQAAINLSLDMDRVRQLSLGPNLGPWQAAHVLPPILRFMRAIELANKRELQWCIEGIPNPFEPIKSEVRIKCLCPSEMLSKHLEKAIRKEKLFKRESSRSTAYFQGRHQMGWGFIVESINQSLGLRRLTELAQSLDPLSMTGQFTLKSDLHLHTAWSDGSASVNKMANAIVCSGLEFFAVTDHSRSSKLQGGLTPVMWIRQANALNLAEPVCPVMHGIEVDILKNGQLDLPESILRAADIVVASVHSSWTESARENTDRLLRAIESGCIDILAHPTSAIIGKPGIPDYVRLPAELYWDEVFEACALWKVAVEMNCFPSRLDLSVRMLQQAIYHGCAISFGSDAHARSHLNNLRYAEAALKYVGNAFVLNLLTYSDLKEYFKNNRIKRSSLHKKSVPLSQGELDFDYTEKRDQSKMEVQIQPPEMMAPGSRIVGIDLTAGNKATGIAFLEGFTVETCSLTTDEEIVNFVKSKCPTIVSIDSPLGLPGGGNKIDKKAGIVRVAEYDLASVGIPAYPALIDSMAKLTMRGIRLRNAISALHPTPQVIESYPGAAQDILCIPRKQKSLGLLREGLRRLGVTGVGLDTSSHDEMDAITSAVVGRYYEVGRFEPMGIPSEAQLIVPKVRPLKFNHNPIICLAGKTGAGKSVVARYLSLFYGFNWMRTRDVIKQLLLDDIAAPVNARMFQRTINPNAVTESDLREFGAIVLTKYRQVPLRRKLLSLLQDSTYPIVVDSIRDLTDVDRSIFGGRPVWIWFIDTDDTSIRKRLSERTKNGEKRIPTASPVDITALAIRDKADQVIPNFGSLEDLRWEIDDKLCDSIAFLNPID